MTHAQVHRVIRAAQSAAKKAREKAIDAEAAVMTYWPTDGLRLQSSALREATQISTLLAAHLRLAADWQDREENKPK